MDPSEVAIHWERNLRRIHEDSSTSLGFHPLHLDVDEQQEVATDADPL